MADPNSDDLGQDGADPFDGVTPAQLLGAAAKTQGFEVEVSEPFEVLEWRPPRDTPQGRMPASVKARALLRRARTVANSSELLDGEELEVRYGRKLAVKDGPTYDELPVDYCGGRRGPLAPGTLGRLMAMDADTGRSKRTGQVSFPELPARHKLAHGVFVPGLRAGADLDYQVPGQGDDLIFLGSDDLSAGVAWTSSDTSTELRGATIKIGANAVAAAIRTGDSVNPGAAMAAWALVLETFVNGIAPGTFTGANSFATTVAAPANSGNFGASGTGSQIVTVE